MRNGWLVAGALAVGLFAPTTATYAEFTPSSMFRYDENGVPIEGPGITPPAYQARVSYTPIKREVVSFDRKYGRGTIVINTAERRLYLVQGDGTALRYGIGVGRPGFAWSGVHSVTRKAEWPGWTPPPQMRKRVPNLPAYMPGGPDNPLGARAMYLGSTFYRIHGSNEPWSIGQAVSSGCFRMTNEDVTDLYERVNVGAKVIVIN